MVSTGLTVLTAIVSGLSLDPALTNQTTPMASDSDAATPPATTSVAFPDQYECFDCSSLERPACGTLLIACPKNVIVKPYRFEMNHKLKQRRQQVSARARQGARLNAHLPILERRAEMTLHPFSFSRRRIN
jgi:hypothetical protein